MEKTILAVLLLLTVSAALLTYAAASYSADLSSQLMVPITIAAASKGKVTKLFDKKP